MNVVHFSTFDSEGGAALSALRIHRSLLDAGVDSRLVVRRRLLLGDPTIERLVPGPVNESPYFEEVEKWLANVRGQYGAALERTGMMFSTYRSPEGMAMLRRAKGANILHFHWMGENFLDYRVVLGPRGVTAPIVWRLPDLNAITGGCHFPRACSRFLTGCGACPALESSSEEDFSFRVFSAKKKAVASHPGVIHYVAPTKWMSDLIGRCPITADRPCSVIYNSVDTEHFRPGDRQEARVKLGLPGDAPVILFVAFNLSSERKGLDVLRRAMARLRGRATLALVGGGAPEPLPDVSQFDLGELDRVDLADVYRAADLVVSPSIEDNLPNVIFEAMAAGRPVVASDVGGIPELVDDDVGRLVPVRDDEALAAALGELLPNPVRLAEMGERARVVASTRLSLERETRAYRDLYESMAVARHGRTNEGLR
jgi:glycosyltransferase involved in cell wall biosynthesis